jgi:hypothetical protein
MIQLKNNWVIGLAIILFILVTLPLFLLKYQNEALVSFALIILYVWIDLHINLLYAIGEKLKFNKMTVIFFSFFGLKNTYFIAFFVLFYALGYFTSLYVYLIIIAYYLFFSIALGNKVLNKPYLEI